MSKLTSLQLFFLRNDFITMKKSRNSTSEGSQQVAQSAAIASWPRLEFHHTFHTPERVENVIKLEIAISAVFANENRQRIIIIMIN